jgi:UDP-N-acetyl-D-mannosaminuronate dehydrogenase
MNKFLEDMKVGKEKICVVGLGYVGLPLAVSLVEHFKVVGFDNKAGSRHYRGGGKQGKAFKP